MALNPKNVGKKIGQFFLPILSRQIWYPSTFTVPPMYPTRGWGGWTRGRTRRVPAVSSSVTFAAGARRDGPNLSKASGSGPAVVVAGKHRVGDREIIFLAGNWILGKYMGYQDLKT